MTAVELLGAPQGKSDAVKAHRVVPPQLEEPVQRRRFGHIVFGMHLEEAESGPSGRDLRYVRRAQADAYTAARDRSTLGHDRGLARSFRSGPLQAAASDLPAGPDRNVDPGIRVPSLLGFAGARMRRSLAVVLRRGRDAKALLRRELRGWGRCCAGEERQRNGGGESGGGE